MNLSQQHRAKTTELELALPGGRLIFLIQGPFHPATRRAWADAILHRLQDLPGIRFEESHVTHREYAGWAGFLFEDRGLTLSRAHATDTPEERHGFEIRMKRLELGWSQEELARRAGLNRSHLSRIERGRVTLHPQTSEKLRRTFMTGTPIPSPADPEIEKQHKPTMVEEAQTASHFNRGPQNQQKATSVETPLALPHPTC